MWYMVVACGVLGFVVGAGFASIAQCSIMSAAQLSGREFGVLIVSGFCGIALSAVGVIVGGMIWG